MKNRGTRRIKAKSAGAGTENGTAGFGPASKVGEHILQVNLEKEDGIMPCSPN